MDEKLRAEMNEQINKELYSAYLYQSMMAHFEAQGLTGIAHWMRVQSMEEVLHAYKFYDYIIERGGKVQLLPIEGPPTEWASPLAAFEQVLEHEKFVTSRINHLMDIALELRDHAAVSFLQWYVDEQVEEEASAEAIIQKLRLIGDNGNGLLMLDKELGMRVFTVPAGMPAEVGGTGE